MSAPGPSRRSLAAWAALSAGAVLLAFAPVAFGPRTLVHYDTHRLYAPIRTLVVEALRAGRLPLWNPYEATGKPLFAEGIHGVLHPISLLGAALAPSSVDFLILAYLVAAALGAFSLARTLGASPAASAGAGIAFALSGYSVSMTGNLVFLAGLATLPWLLAAAREAGAGGRWGPLLTACATACAFFTGDAQVALVGLGLGLLLAADAGGRRGAARFLAGAAVGLLLSAVQLLATRELLPRTYRSLELPLAEKNRWPLAPWRLLEAALPGLSRGSLATIPTGTSGRWIDFEFSESVYLGAPILFAAALSLALRDAAGRRRRTAVLLGGASLGLLWLALGHHLGARQLLDAVPIWSRFRYAEKLVAPLALCGCALGALGIDAFGGRPLARRWRLALAAAAVGAGGLLLALRVAPGAADGLATRLVGDAGPFYRSTLAGALPHLLAALAALLALDRFAAGPARTTGFALLVALAPAAALPLAVSLELPDTRRYDPPLRLDSDSPVARVGQPLSPLFDLGEAQAYFDTWARNEALLLFPSHNVALRLDSPGSYGAFLPRRATTLVQSLGTSAARSIRRFGLTHVVFPTPTDGATRALVEFAVEGGTLVRRDARLGIELWAVPHRPWAFFPARAMATERPQEAHRELLDLLARGEDSTVVVEAREPPPTAAGRVLRVERGTASLAVEAEADGPSLLVVQDAWWPGWRAWIDGAPTEILAADLLVRAVRWPAGRHRLEMRYEPPGLRLGAWLSGAGAVLSLLLAAWALRKGAAEPA